MVIDDGDIAFFPCDGHAEFGGDCFDGEDPGLGNGFTVGEANAGICSFRFTHLAQGEGEKIVNEGGAAVFLTQGRAAETGGDSAIRVQLKGDIAFTAVFLESLHAIRFIEACPCGLVVVAFIFDIACLEGGL